MYICVYDYIYIYMFTYEHSYICIYIYIIFNVGRETDGQTHTRTNRKIVGRVEPYFVYVHNNTKTDIII